jgi:hypothetical protein
MTNSRVSWPRDRTRPGGEHPDAIGTPPGTRAAIGLRTGMTLAILGACVILAALVAFQGSRGSGYDFAAYDAAARRLAAGEPIYQGLTQAGPFEPGPAGIYLYPPPLAVLLLALVPLGASMAGTAWQALHVGALVAACAVLPVPRAVRLGAFGVAALSLPTLLDLNLGNVSLFVLLATAVAWRRREGAGGGIAAIAAVAVRPQVALLLAWWAWGRRTRPLAWAALAGGAMAVGSALVAGIGGWEAYVRLLGNLRGAGTASSDVGLASLALRGGLAEPLPTLAFAVGAAAAVAGVLLATRRDPEAGFVAATCATLLVVPLLWPHYLVLLVLPAALLAARGHAWGLALPLLGWLPGPLLPLAALAGCWAPLASVPPLAAPSPRPPVRAEPGT